MVSNSLHWTALARTHLHVSPSFPEHALYVVGAKLIINSIFINIITVNWDCIFYILYELKTVEFWLATHLHRKHRHRKYSGISRSGICTNSVCVTIISLHQREQKPSHSCSPSSNSSYISLFFLWPTNSAGAPSGEGRPPSPAGAVPELLPAWDPLLILWWPRLCNWVEENQT